MAIPANQLINIEIISKGIIAAGGSNAKAVNNVYTFRRTNTTLPVSKPNIEAAFQAAIMIPVTNALNAAYTQTGNALRFLNDATDPHQLVARAVAGQIAGARQQNYDAVAMTLRTAYRGKSGRGSKHFSPISEADTTGDVLVAGAVTLWNLVKAALLAGFTDSDGNFWTLTIVSRFAEVGPSGNPPLSQLKTNPTTVFSNDVFAILLDKTTGTMRKRKAATVIA